MILKVGFSLWWWSFFFNLDQIFRNYQMSFIFNIKHDSYQDLQWKLLTLFVKSVILSAPLMVAIIKWVSLCLQGNEISCPLFCFAVMADSSGIVWVACLMCLLLLCGTIVLLHLVLHASCLRESSLWLSSAWVVLHGCGVNAALSVKIACILWYPAFMWWGCCEISWGPAAARVCRSQEREERWWLECTTMLMSLVGRDVWPGRVDSRHRLTELAKSWSCVGGKAKCNFDCLDGRGYYRTCL